MPNIEERRATLAQRFVTWTPRTLDHEEVIAGHESVSQVFAIKVPKRAIFLEPTALPTTPTGKVQKFKLVELVTSLPEGAPA